MTSPMFYNDSFGQDLSAAQLAASTMSNSMSSLTGQSLAAHSAISKLASAFSMPGFGRFSTQAAAAQQQLQQLRATAQVAGQDFGSLTRAADNLARSFPIGTAGARNLVGTIQSLGVTADKHSTNVERLGQAFIQLGAATGSSADVIGRQMANLNRAFGDQSLDPKRINSMGDSLVALQAKFGGSASSIAQFAQAISPFARQAGLSEKATLGIAGAFQRLGDDSSSAATAVSKMMADINQAMRDGGPQMQKYAAIVGMTTGSFQSMYRSNPGQALTSVVQALGAPGAVSQRELENLGFADSFRTQRALAELTQSGGLAQAIATSVNAPAGTMSHAAGTVMSGLNDSLDKLSSNSTLLAEKLGAAALGPLTTFSNVMSKIVGTISDVAGSGVAQTALTVGGYAMATRMAAGKGLLGATAYGIGRNLYGSDVLAATRMGARAAREGLSPEDLAGLQESVAAQVAANPNRGIGRLRARQAERDALRLQTMMNNPVDDFKTKTALRAYGAAYGARSGLAPHEISAVIDEHAAKGGTVGDVIKNWGAMATARGLDWKSNLIRPGSDPEHEVNTMFWGGMKSAVKGVFKTGEGHKSLGDAGAEIRDTFRSTNEAMVKFREETSATGEVLGAIGRRGGALAFAGRKAAGTALNIGESMLGMGAGALSSPMGMAAAGVMAGGFLYHLYQGRQQERQQQMEDFKASSISSNADVFNQALGRAAQSTTTFADQVQGNAARLSGNTPTTFSDAMNVSSSDVLASKGYNGLAFQGSTQQAIAEINSTSTAKMDPAYMGQLKLNLLQRGYSASQIKTILSGVRTGGGPMTSSDANTVIDMAVKQTANYGQPGSGTKRLLDGLLQNIAQTYDQNKSNYGEAYADDQRNQAYNALLSEASNYSTKVKDGNLNVASYLFQQMGTQVKGGSWNNVNSGNKGAFQVSGVAKPAVQAGDLFTSLTDTTRPGGSNPVAKWLSSLFDQRAGGNAAGLLNNINSSSASSQLSVVAALLQAASKSKAGTGQVSVDLLRGASNLPAGQLQSTMLSTADQANQMSIAMAPNQSASLGMQLQYGKAMASLQGDDPAIIGMRMQGLQTIMGVRDQIKQMYQQRIQAQIQYQLQSGRSAEDFYRQQGRAEEDFHIGRMRAQRDFNKQMARMAEDAAHSMYDPYHRIGVEALYDSKSLLVNLGDQNQAMQQQVADLAKARQMGLSNQAIQQLGLSDSSHAQQLQELVSGSSAMDIKNLNRMVQNRVRLAGKLTQDQGNLSYVRAKQDFQQAMADQNADFAKSNARAAQDFATAQGRMAQDFHNSQLSITDDMTTLHANFNKVLKGQAIDTKSVMSDTVQQIDSLLQSSTFSDLNKLVMSTDGVSLLTNLLTASAGLAAKDNPKVNVSTYSILNNGGLPASMQTSPAGLGHAAGGIVTSMTHAIVGEAGPEAIVPLNAGGMHIIRAIERYMGGDLGVELKGARTGMARTHVTVYASNHYDHSVRIDKVESHADSRQFMRDMEEMSRRANLTATATRRKHG